MTVLDDHLGDNHLRLVDVGARGGIADRWKRLASVLEVVAFEPDTAECDRLNREATGLPYPIRYLPFALWSEPAEGLPFHITHWPVASSFHRPNTDFLRSFAWSERLFEVRDVETIAVTTLDAVAQREAMVADCLKVDVEGAALDVLIGAEGTLREILVLEVEAELNPVFTGEALFPAVDSHLRTRGWVLQGLRRTSWRRGARLDPSASGLGGQIVSVDALYCNEQLIRDGLSLVRELKLLAILSAYLQIDAVLARLDGVRAKAGLTPAEADELQRLLVPPPGPVRSIEEGALAELDSAARRGLVDAMQPGNATVWEDPHFF
jgi:FkbM family methyltransferase